MRIVSVISRNSTAIIMVVAVSSLVALITYNIVVHGIR